NSTRGAVHRQRATAPASAHYEAALEPYRSGPVRAVRSYCTATGGHSVCQLWAVCRDCTHRPGIDEPRRIVRVAGCYRSGRLVLLAELSFLNQAARRSRLVRKSASTFINAIAIGIVFI